MQTKCITKTKKYNQITKGNINANKKGRRIQRNIRDEMHQQINLK